MLTPDTSGWDSKHVCDPAVVKGSFGNGLYQYAMFYTGTDSDNVNNQVGVAFSNSYNGPWQKWSGNPLMKTTSSTSWGVGQPSATAISGGSIMLFFTRGDRSGTRVMRMTVDFTNLNSPLKNSELVLTKIGLTSRDGSPEDFHNADFVYDSRKDRFIVVRERHPFDTNVPSWVASEVQIVWINGSSVWNGGGSWTVMGNIIYSANK
jgi:hypothetical protein